MLSARIQQLEEAKKLLTETWQRESQRQYATIDQALEVGFFEIIRSMGHSTDNPL